jgi:hypothetical protein
VSSVPFPCGYDTVIGRLKINRNKTCSIIRAL